MNNTDLIRRLRKRATELGSQAAAADELGISAAYFCDMLKGRREPGPTVLKAMGYRREVRYLPADER